MFQQMTLVALRCSHTAALALKRFNQTHGCPADHGDRNGVVTVLGDNDTTGDVKRTTESCRVRADL